MENKILELLQSMQDQMNSIQSDITSIKYEQLKVNERLTNLETKVDNLELGQKEIKDQLTGFQNEYTETIQTVPNKIDNIDSNIQTLKTDLLTVEAVTGKNMADITHLKAIK